MTKQLGTPGILVMAFLFGLSLALSIAFGLGMDNTTAAAFMVACGLWLTAIVYSQLRWGTFDKQGVPK